MEKEEWFKIQKLESKVEKMSSDIIELQKENKEQRNLIKVTMVLELLKINNDKIIELEERFKNHINSESHNP